MRRTDAFPPPELPIPLNSTKLRRSWRAAIVTTFGTVHAVAGPLGTFTCPRGGETAAGAQAPKPRRTMPAMARKQRDGRDQKRIIVPPQAGVGLEAVYMRTRFLRVSPYHGRP